MQCFNVMTYVSSKRKNVQRSCSALRQIFLAALITLLAACAAVGIGPVPHSFSFGDWGENEGVEIIDYRYGDSNIPFTLPLKHSGNQIPQRAHMFAFFPVGRSLYVKWQVKATGTVYEDTVDLRWRLPFDMENKRVHFLIRDPQLYVYVVSRELHAKSAANCPLVVYKIFKCTEVYPQQSQNF